MSDLKVENISIEEYLNLEDKSEFHWLMNYAKPYRTAEDLYDIGDVKSLSFGFIKDYQSEFVKGMSFVTQLNLTTDVLGIDKDDKLINVCRGLTYLDSEIVKIAEMESAQLQFSPSGKEISAGIDSFNKFGAYSQFRKLAGGDITKIEKVREMSYYSCFVELLYLNTEASYQKRLNK